MTDYAPPDIPSRMGRPPLKPNEKTVKTTLRVTQAWLDRIEAVAGEGKTAAFIRDAVEAELVRRERKPRSTEPSGADGAETDG